MGSNGPAHCVLAVALVHTYSLRDEADSYGEDDVTELAMSYGHYLYDTEYRLRNTGMRLSSTASNLAQPRLLLMSSFFRIASSRNLKSKTSLKVAASLGPELLTGKPGRPSLISCVRGCNSAEQRRSRSRTHSPILCCI